MPNDKQLIAFAGGVVVLLLLVAIYIVATSPIF